MTYPIRQPPDGDPTWGNDVRAAIAGVNDHQTRLTTLEGTAVNSADFDNAVKITQAAYDALGTKDARTIYIIVG